MMGESIRQIWVNKITAATPPPAGFPMSSIGIGILGLLLNMRDTMVLSGLPAVILVTVILSPSTSSRGKPPESLFN